MTYIHPDGTRVESEDDGRVILFDGEDPVVDLYPSCAAAIHAAFLDSLGLWLDEETGCLVDTASRSARGSSTAFKVLQREAEGWIDDEGWTDRTNRDERDQAVDRYVATLTPPQPEPQPGEVWEVTLDDGPMRVHVSAGRQLHQLGTGVWCSPDLPRRRLMTADGEWVGGES